MMTNKKSLAILAAMAFAFLVVAGSGCGSSSSSGGLAGQPSNEDQFVNALGDVVDDIQSIANSAFSNRRIVTAINDIARQYLITSATDTTLANRAIGQTLLTATIDALPDSITSDSYDRAAYVELWSGKHITVENNNTTVKTGYSDFQLTINSGDHTTKLTVTPNSSNGYWNAYAGISTILSSLFNDQIKDLYGEHTYLVFVYVFSSANIAVTYDNDTLLEGTITYNATGKTAGTTTNPVYVYENSPHRTDFNLTLYPQDNKDYDVVIDFTRNVASAGSNSISNTSSLNMYRRAENSTSTLLTANAGMNLTIPSGSAMATDATLTALDMNVANKIRVAESNPLNVIRLMELYVTGDNATDATLSSNVAEINTLLTNAGLALYLNQNTEKAGDIRAVVGTFGNNNTYKHARLGIQFAGDSETKLVKDIANPDDLQQLRSLVGNVSGQAQVLANLLTTVQGMGILGDVDISGNSIIRLIFNDLFGR